MNIKNLFLRFLLVLLALALAALACSTKDSEDSGEAAMTSVSGTIQAEDMQATLHAQETTIAAMQQNTLEAPTVEPLPPTEEPAPPTEQQPNPPIAPPEDLHPTIRTIKETTCWYSTAVNSPPSQIFDKIPAGQELEVIYKTLIRKDANSPWMLNYVKVQAPNGCTCWVRAKEVEVNGDLSGIKDVSFAIDDLDAMFGVCP